MQPKLSLHKSVENRCIYSIFSKYKVQKVNLVKNNKMHLHQPHGCDMTPVFLLVFSPLRDIQKIPSEEKLVAPTHIQ